MNIFVEELSRGKVSSGLSSDGTVKLEDNVGESIHLHYDNFRIEMSISDFEKFAANLWKAKETLYGNR